MRGPLTNAGAFSDLVHEHSTSDDIDFGFRLHNPEPGTNKGELGVNRPEICQVSFRAATSPGVVNLYKYAVYDSFGRPLLIRTRKSSGYSLEKIRTWAPEGSNSNSPTDKAARREIRSSQPYHFLFRSNRVWTSALEAAQPHRHGPNEETDSIRDAEPVELSAFTTQYCAVVDFIEDHVQTFLRNLVYLGPIREEPKRLYEISGDSPPDVGTRGEFSPEIILRASKTELFPRVNQWLKKFGMPGNLQCDRLTEMAFSLVVEPDGDTHNVPEGGSEEVSSKPNKTNFADMGFGFSQVLPLIVQGLTATSNSLLIAEQPEIHLNPRLQSCLAEFFAEVIVRKVSLLVETHSEHLLLSIRRLIAEGKIKSSDVAIYYVENNDGISRVREVAILPNGHIGIEDWPKGFFEDSLRESFALATAQSQE
jgi:AAA ATPase domain/Protein of unknown function (DUF3696)